MKKHDQMCGLAVALDYVGDRWTLLIVRELLVEPRTFSQIQGGIPRCSPKLLSERLSEMTERCLIENVSADGARRGVYRLTELGCALREPVEALIRWGGGVLQAKSRGAQQCPHWLEVAVPALLRPRLKAGCSFRLQLEVDGHSFCVVSDGSSLDVLKTSTGAQDVSLRLSYPRALALVSGAHPLSSITQAELGPKVVVSKTAFVNRLREILR